MAMDLKLPELPKLPKLKKGKAPTKTFINIVAKKKQPFNLKKNLPLILVLVVVVLVVLKFTMFDRVAKIVVETNRVSAMQEELAEANAKIGSMQEVDDLYAHYTTSGMTEEELGRVDRVAAMKLIDKKFMKGNISKSWNLTGNVMTLKVNGPSLRELNQVAADLEQNAIVERCVIQSANKKTADNGEVDVTFVIYLKKADQEKED